MKCFVYIQWCAEYGKSASEKYSIVKESQKVDLT